MADRTGATVYTRLEDALADAEVDAVDIMLPHALHEAAAVLAFKAARISVIRGIIASLVCRVQAIWSWCDLWLIVERPFSGGPAGAGPDG